MSAKDTIGKKFMQIFVKIAEMAVTASKMKVALAERMVTMSNQFIVNEDDFRSMRPDEQDEYLISQREGEVYRTYEVYEYTLDLIEDEQNYDLDIVALYGAMEPRDPDDTEEFIRQWLLSRPQVGDILHQHPSDLPIKRIA